MLEGGASKKVVIVGAQWAGRLATQTIQKMDPELKNVEILLIDKQPNFEIIWGMYMCFTDEGEYEKNLVYPHEEAIKSYGSSRVTFKQGMLTKVNSDENKIEIESIDGGASVIDYDILMIATGGSCASPLKAPDQEATTKEQRIADFKQYRDQINDDSNILVVGAGSTGVETACYIKEAVPKAQVSICCGGPKLLPQFKGGHEQIMPTLTKLGVTALTGTRYEKGGPLDDKYNCIIDCMGFKFTAPGYFMQDQNATCLDKRTG